MSGTTNTSFTVAWASDGNSCTWDLNGVPQPDVLPCNGTSVGPLAASADTWVTLHATGPGGSRAGDSNHVTIAEAPPLPTCSASISPASGDTTTAFTIGWTSDGATCTTEVVASEPAIDGGSASTAAQPPTLPGYGGTNWGLSEY